MDRCESALNHSDQIDRLRAAQASTYALVAQGRAAPIFVAISSGACGLVKVAMLL